jgi:N-acetylneuraminate synthase
LTAGFVINVSDLDVKRPGTGLPPEAISVLTGKQLIRNVEGDTLLSEADYAD